MTADPSLLAKLQADYSEFTFKPGTKFAWRPPKTIIYDEKEPNFDLLLLHELGHALLDHRDYSADVTRLKMETAAWEQAKSIAEKYNVTWDAEVAESELDTYRNWLHQKSRCPICGLTRFQDDSGYHCPRCENFS